MKRRPLVAFNDSFYLIIMIVLIKSDEVYHFVQMLALKHRICGKTFVEFQKVSIGVLVYRGIIYTIHAPATVFTGKDILLTLLLAESEPLHSDGIGSQRYQIVQIFLAVKYNNVQTVFVIQLFKLPINAIHSAGKLSVFIFSQRKICSAELEAAVCGVGVNEVRKQFVHGRRRCGFG